MIVFFDKYTESVGKLQETMKALGRKNQIAVLTDDGFLPDGILSPYEFFAYRHGQEKPVKRDLFYNFIELPEFWEVRLMGWMGGIFDMGVEKARIYFREPLENRKVQRVEWHMEDGWTYKIDYYNQYGLKYISEFLDTEGNVESKVFYSGHNQEIIVEQPVNQIVSLLENGAIRKYFTSYVQFIHCYLNESGLEEECMLFVQEEKTFEILGLASKERKMWSRLLFADPGLWKQYVDMGGKNGSRFYAVPEIYPKNHAGNEALILTASDRVEKLEELVSALPDLTFHIAANTQVSDKLSRLGERDHVKVYPQISAQDLERLWNQCDYYLDINHYREIYDAVLTAHEKNLLLMGFENTVHHREFMADACVFAEQEYEKMVFCIKAVEKDAALMRKLLAAQQQKKRIIWEELLK